MFINVKQYILENDSFNTLKNRSRFRVNVIGDLLVITNSSGSQYKVTELLFNKVLQRFNTLNQNDRFTSSQYTDPTWVECPNRITSVYIAAIIKQYFER